jgi:ketosteroid isomerase-like protein
MIVASVRDADATGGSRMPTQPATTMIAKRFMETLREVERSRDVEPLVGLFDEQAQASNLAMPRPFAGKDGVRRFWREYLHAFGRVRSEFTHVFENRSGIVLEWRSCATLRNGGEEIEYSGVSVIEVRSGRIVSFRAYYDSAALLPRPRVSPPSQAA